MKYKIIILPTALKTLEKIEKKFAAKIKEKISLLERKPRHSGCIKLSGEKNFYYTRVGKYRIIYEIHDEKVLVMVVNVEYRRDVSKKLFLLPITISFKAVTSMCLLPAGDKKERHMIDLVVG